MTKHALLGLLEANAKPLKRPRSFSDLEHQVDCTSNIAVYYELKDEALDLLDGKSRRLVWLNEGNFDLLQRLRKAGLFKICRFFEVADRWELMNCWVESYRRELDEVADLVAY